MNQRVPADGGDDVIILPACLDRESRGEFWGYAGQTFQMYLKAGVPPDKARRYALQDTNEQITGFIELERQRYG